MILKHLCELIFVYIHIEAHTNIVVSNSNRVQARIASCRGGVIEIDTWVGASGKNGMKRDWQLRCHSTGRVFARATRYIFKS